MISQTIRIIIPPSVIVYLFGAGGIGSRMGIAPRAGSGIQSAKPTARNMTVLAVPVYAHSGYASMVFRFEVFPHSPEGRGRGPRKGLEGAEGDPPQAGPKPRKARFLRSKNAPKFFRLKKYMRKPWVCPFRQGNRFLFVFQRILQYINGIAP
jgi:hypothetical protein